MRIGTERRVWTLGLYYYGRHPSKVVIFHLALYRYTTTRTKFVYRRECRSRNKTKFAICFEFETMAKNPDFLLYHRIHGTVLTKGQNFFVIYYTNSRSINICYRWIFPYLFPNVSAMKASVSSTYLTLQASIYRFIVCDGTSIRSCSDNRSLSSINLQIVSTLNLTINFL